MQEIYCKEKLALKVSHSKFEMALPLYNLQSSIPRKEKIKFMASFINHKQQILNKLNRKHRRNSTVSNAIARRQAAQKNTVLMLQKIKQRNFTTERLNITSDKKPLNNLTKSCIQKQQPPSFQRNKQSSSHNGCLPSIKKTISILSQKVLDSPKHQTVIKPNSTPVIKLADCQPTLQIYSKQLLNINKDPLYAIKQLKPRLTADCVCVLDTLNQQILFNHQADFSAQIASLTKIMTCITTLLICKYFKKDLITPARVSDQAASMQGTSAQLKAGDQLSIEGLLHGLMLPSGNDASVALAQYCGKLVYKLKFQQRQLKQPGLQNGKKIPAKNYIRCFITQMNKVAKAIGMANSAFDCPHGLSNQKNFSTAADLCTLVAVAIQYPNFKKIVSCKSYKSKIFNERSGLYRTHIWHNSNRLLNEPGYFGVKTGVTPSAGPCFAGYFKREQNQLIVILLNTENCTARFKQTHRIVTFILQRRGQTYPHQIQWRKKRIQDEDD